eukprot:sb/3467787/
MSSLISLGAKTGAQAIRYILVRSIDRGDFTNDQLLSVLENKLDSISKDLEDLKLQKLKSAAFLIKSGFKMYMAGDVEESKRNFDKAEMDAVEGYSTSPTIEWKLFSVKLSIFSVVWRKVVLSSGPVNYTAVMDQVGLYLSRLLEDQTLKSIFKTHLSGSVFSSINKTKRESLINQITELEKSCQKIIFDTFLEILPFSEVKIDTDKSVSLAQFYSRFAYLVPYSVNQCATMDCEGIIDRWQNHFCNVSLVETTTGDMISCGYNNSSPFTSPRDFGLKSTKKSA